MLKFGRTLSPVHNYSNLALAYFFKFRLEKGLMKVIVNLYSLIQNHFFFF